MDSVRVQYSVFECWLEEDRFRDLWQKLQRIISHQEDRLVAYTLDAGAARKRLSAGDTMVCTQRASHYSL